MDSTPFTPLYGEGITLAVTAVTARTALGTTGTNQLRVSNSGSSTLYFRTGDSAVDATTADCPLLAANTVVLSINPLHTHIAAICGGADTSTLLAINVRGV